MSIHKALAHLREQDAKIDQILRDREDDRAFAQKGITVNLEARINKMQKQLDRLLADGASPDSQPGSYLRGYIDALIYVQAKKYYHSADELEKWLTNLLVSSLQSVNWYKVYSALHEEDN